MAHATTVTKMANTQIPRVFDKWWRTGERWNLRSMEAAWRISKIKRTEKPFQLRHGSFNINMLWTWSLLRHQYYNMHLRWRLDRYMGSLIFSPFYGRRSPLKMKFKSDLLLSITFGRDWWLCDDGWYQLRH